MVIRPATGKTANSGDVLRQTQNGLRGNDQGTREHDVTQLVGQEDHRSGGNDDVKSLPFIGEESEEEERGQGAPLYRRGRPPSEQGRDGESWRQFRPA